MALLARSAAPGPARQRLRPRGCGSGALLDRFGVLVQALLAVAAFGTLMRGGFLVAMESGSPLLIIPPCQIPWTVLIFESFCAGNNAANEMNTADDDDDDDDNNSKKLMKKKLAFSKVQPSSSIFIDLRSSGVWASMVTFLGIWTSKSFFYLLFSVKRFKEPKAERRPWRIWFYDTSKQAIGAVFIHVANVFLSDLTEEDPCSLYLMNFLLDATLGMLGVWTGVKVVSWIVERRKYTHLVFGEYGDPPQAGAWIGQCTLYLLIMVFAKTAVGLLLLIPGWRKLQEILLDYMPDPQMELVLMMLVVPFTVNAATFWVVDSLIMKKHKQKEILKFESSRRMEDSQALKEEQYQVRTQRHFCHCFKKLSLDSLCLKVALLCPALDFDRSRGNADLLGSLPHGMNSSIKQPDFQDTLGQGFVTKLNGGESDHC
ncbi:Store-operated calcium entry regulator STIMATE [Varanus komodoensis]|nr:Store-operated calcium entry regulator STIMATE [Varanus komodoensis]